MYSKIFYVSICLFVCNTVRSQSDCTVLYTLGCCNGSDKCSISILLFYFYPIDNRIEIEHSPLLLQHPGVHNAVRSLWFVIVYNTLEAFWSRLHRPRLVIESPQLLTGFLVYIQVYIYIYMYGTFMSTKYMYVYCFCGFVIFICLSPSLDIPETLLVVFFSEWPFLLYAVYMFHTV